MRFVQLCDGCKHVRPIVIADRTVEVCTAARGQERKPDVSDVLSSDLNRADICGDVEDQEDRDCRDDGHVFPWLLFLKETIDDEIADPADHSEEDDQVEEPPCVPCRG